MTPRSPATSFGAEAADLVGTEAETACVDDSSPATTAAMTANDDDDSSRDGTTAPPGAAEAGATDLVDDAHGTLSTKKKASSGPGTIVPQIIDCGDGDSDNCDDPMDADVGDGDDEQDEEGGNDDDHNDEEEDDDYEYEDVYDDEYMYDNTEVEDLRMQVRALETKVSDLRDEVGGRERELHACLVMMQRSDEQVSDLERRLAAAELERDDLLRRRPVQGGRQPVAAAAVPPPLPPPIPQRADVVEGFAALLLELLVPIHDDDQGGGRVPNPPPRPAGEPLPPPLPQRRANAVDAENWEEPPLRRLEEDDEEEDEEEEVGRDEPRERARRPEEADGFEARMMRLRHEGRRLVPGGSIQLDGPLRPRRRREEEGRVPHGADPDRPGEEDEEVGDGGDDDPGDGVAPME